MPLLQTFAAKVLYGQESGEAILAFAESVYRQTQLSNVLRVINCLQDPSQDI